MGPLPSCASCTPKGRALQGGSWLAALGPLAQEGGVPPLLGAQGLLQIVGKLGQEREGPQIKVAAGRRPGMDPGAVGANPRSSCLPRGLSRVLA